MVIVPKVAQRLVDQTNLPIYSGAITNPAPDHIKFSLRSSLKIPGPFTVTLKPIRLFLYNRDTAVYSPYAYVDLEEQHVKGNYTLDVKDHVAPITNRSEFEGFLNDAFYGQKVALSVKGSTTASIGALKVPVKLEKTVEINGKHLQYALRLSSD